MKAISLHEPYATLVANGTKIIETRTWRTNYRGDLLICATKKYPELPLAGKALAVVELVDCRPMEESDAGLAGVPFDKNKYSWFLMNIRKIEPFSVRGRQGLFNVDYDIPNRI